MIAKVVLLGIARFTKLLQFVYARPKVRSLRMKRPNITWMHAFVLVVKAEGELPADDQQGQGRGTRRNISNDEERYGCYIMEFQISLTVMRIFLTIMGMLLQIMNQMNSKRNQSLFNRMLIMNINISL